MTPLEVLHKCAQEYNKKEKKKYKLSEQAKIRKNEREKTRRQNLYNSNPEYRERVKEQSRKTYKKHKEKQKCENTEEASEYDKRYAELQKDKSRRKAKDKKMSVEKVVEIIKTNVPHQNVTQSKRTIPEFERARCTTPWCMCYVNGMCCHRTCVVEEGRLYIESQKDI